MVSSQKINKQNSFIIIHKKTSALYETRNETDDDKANFKIRELFNQFRAGQRNEYFLLQSTACLIDSNSSQKLFLLKINH